VKGLGVVGIVALGLVLAVGLGLLGWWFWSRTPPQGESPAAVDARAEQVAQGKRLYEQNCASCHQQGGIGPELTALVLSNYRTADRLFRYVSRAMPYNAPGSLDEQTYWDILAFLLAENGMLPEGVVLGPETAPQVELKRK